MTIKQIENKIDKIRTQIGEEFGGEAIDLADELVELEILLESECNK